MSSLEIEVIIQFDLFKLCFAMWWSDMRVQSSGVQETVVELDTRYVHAGSRLRTASNPISWNEFRWLINEIDKYMELSKRLSL